MEEKQKKQPKDRNEAANEPLRDEELENVSGGVDWQVSDPNGRFPDDRRRPPLFGPGSGMIGEITGS